jgi:regulatory protein
MMSSYLSLNNFGKKLCKLQPFSSILPMRNVIMEERRQRPLDSEALWTYALKLLGGSARSTGEMREKLLRRAEHPVDVEPVIARLKDATYLDDRRFAEAFASGRLANDRLGRARVVLDLRRRRVAPALAAETVRAVYETVDEQALIEEWIRHKYCKTPREGLFADRKDMATAYRRMQQAGFPSSAILDALKRFAKNPELLDSFEPPEPPPEDE